MTKFVTRHTSKTALILSSFHSTFENSISGLHAIKPAIQLNLRNDPVSTQHILVERLRNGTVVSDNFRLEKKDIEDANNDRQALYHLMATVLNHFGATS
ncbi:hypothetical protein [Acinetobacter sp. WZC-1]|uniref:hypothetical protein n=1 Tax=Acinetobacter sp. WZC-1 TaxID=3459034 RepID=UPI00403E1186